jgi:hypothetical protein
MVRLGNETLVHTFSCVGWDRFRFNKKRASTRYAELVFLHPVRSAGHIVHSGAPGARNDDAHFFMFRWDRFRFNKKHDGTRSDELVFSHPVVSAGHVVHSGAFGA